MEIIKNRHLKISIVSISSILLLLSLTQNAYYIAGMEESIGSFGLIAFLIGWMGLSGAGISWLANPILITSWFILIFGKPKLSRILSVFALLFSLSFLLFTEIVANEGGGKKEIIAYDSGYWLWLSSCGLNLIGNLIVYVREE